MIIAIDHGNSEIKTVHEQFTAGFSVFDREPPMAADLLEYAGKYYALTRKRLPYRYDKTADEDYYILTLFAIGKELMRNGITQPAEIQLAVGLPPRYFSNLRDSFSEYFVRGKKKVDFAYNHMTFSICITDCIVFPQCWGAMVTRFSEIKPLTNCTVIDFGGYTVDIIRLHNGIPDMSEVYSLPRGVIHLISEISEEMEARTGSAPNDSMITDVLCGRQSMLSLSEQKFITESARKFTDKLTEEISHEKNVNASREQIYFTGGGALLLKDFLRNIGNVRFITDPKANAKGYAIVAGGLIKP
jgi:plasmid segregation protein ParM